MTGQTPSADTHEPPETTALPTGAAWFAQSTSDHGAHYGEMHVKTGVHAVCGARFVPLNNPLTGAVAWWRRPVDPLHACPACRDAS